MSYGEHDELGEKHTCDLGRWGLQGPMDLRQRGCDA